MTRQVVISILSQIINMAEEDLSERIELASDYGIEPIDIAKLIIELERHFKIVIQDEDVHEFKTLADLVAYIDKLLD